MVLAKLAGSNDIQAAVILHPGEITEDEIKGKPSPVSAEYPTSLTVAKALLWTQITRPYTSS